MNIIKKANAILYNVCNMYCVIQSDPGGLIVSEKEAWRIDQPVKVGVSVEVRHS